MFYCESPGFCSLGSPVENTTSAKLYAVSCQGRKATEWLKGSDCLIKHSTTNMRWLHGEVDSIELH